MTAPTRPVLRWHGSKFRLASWVMRFFPRHRVYTESFGGGGNILLCKERSHAEVWNDLDDEVVNFFTVMRHPIAAAELERQLRLTPFARRELEIAFEVIEEPIERARRLVVRCFMGFGSNAHAIGDGATTVGRTTGFRANSNKSGTTPAHDWVNYPDVLPVVCARLQGVIIEHRPAADVMRQHDGGGTLHYVDPPYLPETRSPANKYDLKHRMYRHELTVDDHAELLAFLQTLEGMVVLSGYPSELYDSTLKGWRRMETKAHADGARPRTEVVWLNPACVAALNRECRQRTLFEAAE